MDLEKLGTFIHNKREEVGIPLAKAAQKAGIGRSTLWILESGKNPRTGKPSRPSKDILERLAEVLHMSQDEREEVFALADYKVDKQSQQISSHVHPTLQSGVPQQFTLSPPAIITEIKGTVYYAHEGHLTAFDARIGKRIWSSSDQVGYIKEALLECIETGEFAENGRLPALPSLATAYQTSQESINIVLKELQAEGWIVSHNSKAYFVRPRVKLPGLSNNPSDSLKEAGLKSVEEYIEPVKVLPPSVQIAESMKMQKEALVVRRFRKFGIPNLVYRFSETYFPKILVSEEMLEKMIDPSYDVLTEIKSQTGKFIKHVHELIVSRLPTQDEQDLLKIVHTNPVIDIKRINSTQDRETVVMFNHIVLNANHFILSYDYSVNLWD